MLGWREHEPSAHELHLPDDVQDPGVEVDVVERQPERLTLPQATAGPEREHLPLSSGIPVLDVLHTSIDTDGEPYELTRFVMRADLSGLRDDAPVE